MRRIFFINGHCTDLLMKTMRFFLFKEKVACKYITFLEELVKDDEIEVFNFVTNRGIFVKPSYVHIPMATAIAAMESRYIIKKNGLDGKVKTITDITLIGDDDIVVGFLMGRCGYDRIRDMKGHKYLHLNQYYCFTKEQLNEVVPYMEGFISEANVFQKGNYIFTAKLPEKYNFVHIPFIVQERFKNKVPLKDRKAKALATGTIGPCPNPEYSDFYHTDLIHKMRQIIYDHRDELSAEMDVTISPYTEEKQKFYPKTSDPKLLKLLKILLNSTIYKTHGQAKYFSFDIVAKYNDYQMSVVPEEICDLPGIGAFEAMACGCAMIGIEHKMYTDLGMEPDKHYIAYDGSLEDLRRKIQYYQNHFDELETIANNGAVFAHERFSKKRIVGDIINSLKSNNHF